MISGDMCVGKNTAQPANVRAFSPCAAAGCKSHLTEPSAAGPSSLTPLPDVFVAVGRGGIVDSGHSVGLDIHESPGLSPKNTGELKSGNVVTVEPGLYIPGKCGVRIEDLVVVNENGCEILSKSPKNLVIVG